MLNQRITTAAFHDAEEVNIELEAGQLSLHDVYLVHGSHANRSPHRRAGIAIRYMPGTSRFRRDLLTPGTNAGYMVDFSRRPLWLLRGQDQTGANDFEIGH